MKILPSYKKLVLYNNYEEAKRIKSLFSPLLQVQMQID